MSITNRVVLAVWSFNLVSSILGAVIYHNDVQIIIAGISAGALAFIASTAVLRPTPSKPEAA